MTGARIALVVAAGRGERAGGELPKQYRALGGEPVLRRTLRALLRRFAPDELRVVIDPAHRPLYEAAVRGLDLPEPVAGGSTRRDSVRAGLEALASSPPHHIYVHDAARPFVSSALLDRLARALARAQAVIPVLPVPDSLVRCAEGRASEYVPRTGVARVQTPQAFRFELLLRAHRSVPAGSFHDDGSLVRAIGEEVAVTEGDENNFKLTTAADFARAERLLAVARQVRTGFGCDVHAFAPDRPLVLCGLRLPHPRGLAGHSDADVALHALTDAILATFGAGDIGQHFPPTDPRWRDAGSTWFLGHALKLLARAGGRLAHVDLTIVCEEPKIGPHREAMRQRLGELTGLPPDRLSIKATTTEGLGFTGRREGIAAFALVTADFEDSEEAR